MKVKCIKLCLPYGPRISDNNLLWGQAETHEAMPLARARIGVELVYDGGHELGLCLVGNINI